MWNLIDNCDVTSFRYKVQGGSEIQKLGFGTKFREELRSLVGEAMRGVSLEASLRITIVIAFEI
jgi:hypothetical protein